MRDSKTIAAFLWACAVLGIQPAEGYLGAAVERMEGVLPKASPQAVSIFVWACAALSYRPDVSFLAAAAQSLGRGLSTSKPLGLCHVATAYATFGFIPEKGFMDKMARRFQELQPADVGQVGHMCRAYQALGLSPAVSWFAAGC